MIAARLRAQASPYCVTYDHHMEEPGSLEVAINPVFGVPKAGNHAVAGSLELEYGAKGWWTTALYLDGQSTSREGSGFTGYRFENRFRLLMQEHWINPVLYVEFADVNGADKISKEIVGFDSWRDLAAPIEESRHEKKRELETKLILSNNTHGWNFAGNLIAERHLNAAPWEFGYALATSRPLVLAATATECRFCRENLSLGLELYGGLGEEGRMTLSETSHYVAPTIAWSLLSGTTLRVSPGWGLTANSNRAFVRLGISYEGRLFR
ncbi:MAG: hypothetical protein M3041_12330 [Acidobacteriota bacterium]|nr:hypothetical protein [Acidobacteriota bacterium]